MCPPGLPPLAIRHACRLRQPADPKHSLKFGLATSRRPPGRTSGSGARAGSAGIGAKVPSAQTPAIRLRSFPQCTEGAAGASAEIPAGSGEVALVGTAGALSNVGEVRRIPEVAVDGRKLGLARLRKPARGVDDARPHRRCDTGAADNAPTVAIRDVIDPDAGIGVRVGGDVGCPPLAADNLGNHRLVGWARLVLARAAAGRRPGELRLQVSARIAAVRRAAGRYDIRGSRRPDRPCAVAGRCNVYDAGLCEVPVIEPLE